MMQLVNYVMCFLWCVVGSIHGTASASQPKLCPPLPTTIRLNSTNHIAITREIDEKLTGEFLYTLNKIDAKKNVYVYLDTPGGSVQHGAKIVAQIRKHKMSCIAERAHSMGFVIFQACFRRYVLSHSSLMQHQMSYGIQNEKGKVDSYVEFVNSLEEDLVATQALRIGITNDEFRTRIMNDWWLYGSQAVRKNCADAVVDLTCTPELTKKNVSHVRGGYTYTYSRCPLIGTYINKQRNEKQDSVLEKIVFI